MAYTIEKSTNKRINEFDKSGHLIKTYWVRINEQSRKADTSHLEERIYNPITGLLDTLIEFDESNSTFIPNVKVSCYHYDKKNRLEKILKFGLYEIKPEEPKNKEMANYTTAPILPPTDPADTLSEPVNKSGMNGRPVSPATFNIMIRNNDFSSVRYKYYMKNKFEVEEQTELYDFSKKYGKSDTCKSKTFYYSYNKHVLMEFNQFDCTGRDDIPSNYYVYKNGLLDSIVQVSRQRSRDVQLMYDSKSNLTVISNIWDGEKVSYLEMIYDDKGLLKELRRKSTLDKADYFMDNTLVFETIFFDNHKH